MYIIIVGCGKIGVILAKELANYNHHISVIDRDGERLSLLGSGFNGLITKGIEFDHDTLVASGIERADVLLALTENDSVNITLSLVAKDIFHVPRVISQAIDPNRKYVYEALGIEVINPVRIGVNSLLGKLSLSSVEKIAQLSNGYEILRVQSRRVNPISVKEMTEVLKVVVFFVENKKESQLTNEETIIHPNDNVVCSLHIRDRQDFLDLMEEK
jgi:trk system potassium uptake protein TrkA